MNIDLLAEAGFRTAPNLKEKVLEAAQLFNQGIAGGPAEYRLKEALSTSDYPILLGKGFEIEAIQAQKDAVKEFEPFAYETKVPDFRPKKLRDLFGDTEFEPVGEGEEYKSDSLDETEVEVRVAKFGRKFGYTWELDLSGDFSDMADFPRRLGNGAVERSNRNVFGLFVGEDGPNADFFDEIHTEKLTPDAIDNALQELALKENHRGELVDTGGLVLLVPQSLQIEATRIAEASELERRVEDGSGKTIRTRVANPYRGLITVQVSKWLTKIDKSANRASTWYLLASKGSDNPAVVRAELMGHEAVDIRVKRDQGERVGGGSIPFNEGSFSDDTIWFRGRSVDGAAAGFADDDGSALVAYASTGTA